MNEFPNAKNLTAIELQIEDFQMTTYTTRRELSNKTAEQLMVWVTQAMEGFEKTRDVPWKRVAGASN